MSKYNPDRMYKNKVYMAEWRRLSVEFYNSLKPKDLDNANERMDLPDTREVRELHGTEVSENKTVS